jgi:hypothetical protein
MGMRNVDGRLRGAGVASKDLVLLDGLVGAPEQVLGSGEPGAQAVCR